MRRFQIVNIFFISLLALSSCHKSFYPKQSAGHSYAIDSTLSVDSGIVRLLQPYKLGVDTQMQVAIGHSDIPLTKAQPECTLGNFIADAQLAAARRLDNKVVASVVNYGGLRIPYIAPGIITNGRMYELMPFDNMLTIIEIPGDVLKQFCQHMAKFKGWPVSGITYTIRDKEPVNININGQPLNDHIIYKVATNDYVAKGGDECSFLIPLRKKYTSLFIRDIMIDYVKDLEKQGKPLHPQLENRVTYAQ